MTEGGEGRRWPETLVVGGLFALALLLRGWDLGIRPAAPMEAAQAWAAWRGGALPTGGSPLLAGWNATVFAIFGPDEGWMRSGAALAGALGVIALWALTRSVGQAGAIGAAWLWAVSPTALMASRFLDSGAVVAAMLAAVLALWRTLWPSRWFRIVLLLGMGMAAGPALWTGCLMLLPIFWMFPSESALPRWKALGLLGLIALLVSGWGGWRGSGPSEMVEGLSAWLSGFAPEDLPLRWVVLQRFFAGEAPILVLALVSGILAILQRDRFGIALLIAGGIGIGLQFIRFRAPFTEHAVVLVPWVALAGFTVQRIWQAVRPVWQSQRAAVLGGIAINGMGLSIVAVWMNLRGEAETTRGAALVGVLTLVGIGTWIVMSLFRTAREEVAESAQSSGERRTISGSGLWNPVSLGIMGTLAIALVLAQIAGAMALIRQANPISGFSFPEMATPAVREVIDTLKEEAMRRYASLRELSVIVITKTAEEEAFWRWMLRDFEVRVDRHALTPEGRVVWLVPEDVPVPFEPQGWVGRIFPAVVDGRGAQPSERRMTLWMKIP